MVCIRTAFTLATLTPCDYQADSHRTSSQFVAQVRISSKWPSLVLEEMENHFDDVKCSDSTVRLYFQSRETLKLACEELSRVAGFVLITSHQGCNKDGERDTHMSACCYADYAKTQCADLCRVSKLEVHDEGHILVLSVTRLAWKDAVHSIQVDFGSSDDYYELRQEHKIERRQATTTSTPTVTAPTTSVAYPTPTSSGPPPQMPNVNAKINSQWTDTAILPPDNVLGQLMSIGPPLYVVVLQNSLSCYANRRVDLLV